jgi:hypothetical protein
MSMIIDAIPGTWSADQPKKYEPVSVSCSSKLKLFDTEIGVGEGVRNEALCR